MDALTILHLSDIHFGLHQFDPPATPTGNNASNAGYPSLLETIRASLGAKMPDAAIISGDITQAARVSEFKLAAKLLKELAELVGGPERIFLVPGNHDVVFTEGDSEARWTPYCSFYNNFFQAPANAATGRSFAAPTTPDSLSQVIDRSDTLGLVVVEINSSTFVRNRYVKGRSSAGRGRWPFFAA